MENKIQEVETFVDDIDLENEFKISRNFDDANIYQTNSYCNANNRDGNISNIYIRKNGVIVSAAFLRIHKLPFVSTGVAYVRWGPLWKLKDREYDIGNLRHMLKILKLEYVQKKGLLLRIIPNETEKDNYHIIKIYNEEGFEIKENKYRTLIMDITEPLEKIRMNFKASWRKQLNKSERMEIGNIDGDDDKKFSIMEKLYLEMLQRKQFEQGTDFYSFRKIQEKLPEGLKLKIIVCEYENKPTAGIIGAAMGDTGLELIAATGNHGLKSRASYLLRWQLLQYFKEKGCKKYDLNSINPEKNPGGYSFKSGLSGKNGEDIKYLGVFDYKKNIYHSLLFVAIEKILPLYRKLKLIKN